MDSVICVYRAVAARVVQIFIDVGVIEQEPWVKNVNVYKAVE